MWDEHFKSSGAYLSCDNKKVNFHSDYSCGTAAIRGMKELADGQHFWEVMMTSPVYGTDMVSSDPLNNWSYFSSGIKHLLKCLSALK